MTVTPPQSLRFSLVVPLAVTVSSVSDQFNPIKKYRKLALINRGLIYIFVRGFWSGLINGGQ